MRKIAIRLSAAFACIIVFLIVQGGIGYYNARDLWKVQSEGFAKELALKDLQAKLARARLIVYKLLGTMDPSMMDVYKGRFEMEMVYISEGLEKQGIDAALIEENRAVYDEIIHLQYDFSVKTARNLIDTESRDLHDKLVQKLNEQVYLEVEFIHTRIERAHGRILVITIGLSALALLAAFLWALVLMRSLTDRRQAEEALRASEAEYREIFNSIVDVFFRTDQEGRLGVISPSIGKMLGYTPNEVADLRLTDLCLNLEPEDDPFTPLEEHDGIMEFELTLKSKEGTPVQVSAKTQFYRDENGNVLGFQGVMRDISEQKRTEEERARLEIQLRQSQKMEAIGTLAGGIAHDFNNILAAILGYSELAELDIDNKKAVENHLDQIIIAATRAKDLVNQILAFSRKAHHDMQPIDITPIIKEGLKLLRASIPTTIEIQSDLEHDLGMVMADPTQIHQVLMNLCTNAAHAMKQEEGIIRVSLTKAELDAGRVTDLHDLVPGYYIQLKISDTGLGMEPADMERIFEPFFTTKGQGEGTGMGLAVVHGIVQSHGGTITVESEPGKGATFTVYFPVAEVRTTPLTPDEKMPSAGGMERILFVDDEEFLVDSGRQILERLGYQVETAGNGLEALSLIEKNSKKYDLVITDQTMPKMSGSALVGRIHEIDPELPVIICTGFSESLSIEKATKLGARAFLQKPLSLRDLTDIVRKVLDEEVQNGNSKPPPPDSRRP